MTQHHDLFAALAAPFDPSEVKVRSQASRQLHYITARTVMNRLDSVLGPENWWDSYQCGENSVLCTLSVRLPDGQILTKQDAGGYAGMADQGDDDTSGLSDGFKRAAVKFGVARYLYRDGVPTFARELHPSGGEGGQGQGPGDGGTHPQAPANQAPPAVAPAPAPTANGSNGRGAASNSNSNAQPRTGKALFSWTKDQEQRHQVGLIKYLQNWGKLQDFPGRMIDWDGEQVASAHAEAVRKLQAIHSTHTEAYEEALAN